MFDAIKTMNEEQLREVIAGIARSADPWCVDVMAMASDAIDAVGDELMRRFLRDGRVSAAS